MVADVDVTRVGSFTSWWRLNAWVSSFHLLMLQVPSEKFILKSPNKIVSLFSRNSFSSDCSILSNHSICEDGGL